MSDSPEDTARAEWLYNAAEELLRSTNVSFQRRMRAPQGVTAGCNERRTDRGKGSPMTSYQKARRLYVWRGSAIVLLGTAFVMLATSYCAQLT